MVATRNLLEYFLNLIPLRMSLLMASRAWQSLSESYTDQCFALSTTGAEVPKSDMMQG